MTVSIRLAKSEDRQRCAELLNVLAKATSDPHEIFDTETFESLISNERGSLLVAIDNELILGMASISYNLALRYNGEYCQLEELVVDSEARGKNVGGLLIEETISLAKKRGCKEFGLYLLESTKHNQSFYEKYGFEVIGKEMRQPLNKIIL
jgi:ribosomal protein S18 acetylase RimI-like enzyme|tara:strand:- start:10 stop:462 length:453 start_codon:yes stop_codon:yes gene_type:complete